MLRRALPRFALFAATVLALTGCAATSAYDSEDDPNAAYAGDAGDYFDQWSSYGTWVRIADYGWAWCPLDTPIGWRPYTVGYWVWSDYGWLWASDDPWGDIPYHYGRWAYDREYGWVWVPGDVWAPAWVAWRYGDGWVGWAALPPGVDWRAGVGLGYTGYELDQRIDRHRWCFEPATEFGLTRDRVTVEPSSKNVTLLPRTKNVTKYVAGPTPIDRGLPPEAIQESRGHAFVPYRVVLSPTEVTGGGVNGQDNTVQVFRPKGSVTAAVRWRVRDVPATQRPKPSPDVARRVQAEKARLDEAVKAQRDELAKEHAREMEERPPGASVRELKRRQEAELRAQREDETRQKQEIEARERAIAKGQAQVERRERAEERQQTRKDKRERADERANVGRGRGGRGDDPPPSAEDAQPDTLRRPAPRGETRGR